MNDDAFVDVFAALDIEKKGFLTLEDFLRACREFCDCYYEPVFLEVFRELDTDCDGRLSHPDFDSFQKQYLTMFAGDDSKKSNDATSAEGSSRSNTTSGFVSKRRNSRYECWISSDKLDACSSRTGSAATFH